MILAALALTLMESPPARVDGKCIDVSDPQARHGFVGRLGEGRFPSPAASAPPEGEHAFILTLKSPICVDDAGHIADPGERFDRIHLWGSPEVMANLRAALGRHIQVHGPGHAAHNGHHHAPLVIEVERIIVFEEWDE